MPQFQQLEHDDSMGNSPSRSLSSSMNFITNFLAVLWTSIASLFAGMKPPTVVHVNARKFAIVKQLGEGGRPGTDRYALKRIRIQLPEQEERLTNEIAAHKAVNSPFVVKLLDSQVVRERSNGAVVEGILLLPFYSNGTVQDRIDRTPVGEFIPLKTILNIAIDVCKGLSAFQ
ncbi:Serine/threonine-protein kinase 16 [Borealophlyctis nickersoniae]|nr:Serine/threonine-protein kinase 16 [Borealophlyctis nickersoniae]